MIQYRTLSKDELCRKLFKDFIRHQVVTKCRRKENNEWVIHRKHVEAEPCDCQLECPV